jgi:hypothetical protein
MIQIIPSLCAAVVADHVALLKARSMLVEDVEVSFQPEIAAIQALLMTRSFWIKSRSIIAMFKGGALL